jgi:hypothetical protein
MLSLEGTAGIRLVASTLELERTVDISLAPDTLAAFAGPHPERLQMRRATRKLRQGCRILLL